jgi:hypothetical protein
MTEETNILQQTIFLGLSAVMKYVLTCKGNFKVGSKNSVSNCKHRIISDYFGPNDTKEVQT